MRVDFTPIDVEKDAEICVRFQRDAFVVSYGTADEMVAADKYLEWLRHCVSQDPDSRVHAWAESRIIGQCELSAEWRFENTGCVHLYYLLPEMRGRGIGARFDEYATDYFLRRRVPVARLAVSRTNLPALRFYERHGWRSLGPREDHRASLYMEKAFPSAEGSPVD